MLMATQRTRTKALMIRLSDDEREELAELAKHERLPVSDVVRRLVRVEYEDKFATVDISPQGEEGFSIDVPKRFKRHEKTLRHVLKTFIGRGAGPMTIDQLRAILHGPIQGILGVPTRIRGVGPAFYVGRREVRFY